MTPTEQAVFETTIMAACSKHRQDNDYRPCMFIGSDYFVKFGNYMA